MYFSPSRKPAVGGVGSVLKEAGALLRLGLPLIGAQLASIGMGVTDTVMAGNLSPLALAAVAVGGSLWMLVALFVIGLMMAVTAFVSHLFGAGKNEEIGRFVRQASWFGQILACFCFLVIRNADPVLYFLEVDPEIVPVTLGYVDAISWGLPALCALTVLRYFSDGVSRTRPILLISFLGLAVNVGANYVFIYGRLGLPAMGAVGCGWASALVTWMMFGCMLAYVASSKHYRRFHLFGRFDWPRWADLTAIVRLGLPIGISVFLEASMFSVVALLMGSLGTSTVAAHQIAVNIASVTFMIPLGLSMAITVRVGQAMGRRDPAAASQSGFVGVGMAVLIMAVAAILLVSFPDFIVGIYSDDEAVRIVAIELILMAALFQLSDGAQVAGSGALRGLKDTAVPMLITLVAYWAVGIPIGYTLGIAWSMGPRAMWVGLIAGLSVAALCLNSRFYFVIRRHKRLRDESSP